MIFSSKILFANHIGHKNHTLDNYYQLLPVCFLIIGILLLTTGCAATPTKQLQEQNQSIAQPTSNSTAPITIEKSPLPPRPTYKNFADLLGSRGEKKGVIFYLNQEGNYVLFAVKGSDTFFIADKTGTCLFQVDLSLENKTTSQQIISDLSINPGPCGLKYPDVSADIIKIVETMAEEFVIPGLQDRLSGKPWIGECSEKNFLQQTLLQKMPYDINASRTDLEGAISKIGIKIKDPLEIAFGDVIFFPLQKNTNVVGIYMGYGLVVYHKDCSTTAVHRLSGGIQYRIYRPITGFAWTRYQIRDTDFLLNHLNAIK